MDRFIPNDTYIADGSRVALITGANCSGKSVYLKQVRHMACTCTMHGCCSHDMYAVRREYRLQQGELRPIRVVGGGRASSRYSLRDTGAF